MCRAVWVIVAAATEDAAKRLRRAAGPDSQVVALATSTDQVLAAIATTKADAIVVDASLANAAGLVAALRARGPEIATVWVGVDAPADAHAATPWSDAIDDTLPGAITKALLARRA